MRFKRGLKIRNELPNDANDPVVRKAQVATGSMTAIISFTALTKQVYQLL